MEADKRMRKIVRAEEKKQENRYLGKFERPNLPGRKFEPTFVFTK